MNQRQISPVAGPVGTLDVWVEVPESTPVGVAVICHPHPLHGGSMDNKVLWSLAGAAQECGQVAVRFNFRGVGGSEGRYDEGVGETEDARAVLAWAQQRWPRLPVVLMGFSFGAAVALRLAADVPVQALVTVAPPLSYFDEAAMPQPDCPWLLLHGDADEVVPWADTQQRLDRIAAAPDVQCFPGVGHFFHGQLPGLRNCVARWLQGRQ